MGALYVSDILKARGTTIKDRVIFLHEPLRLESAHQISFENCIFELQTGSSIYLSGCNISRCRFHNNLVSKKQGLHVVVAFDSCNKLMNIEMAGYFSKISIANSFVQHFTDISETEEYHIINSRVENFIIAGSAFVLLIENSFFDSNGGFNSHWDKEISINAECKKAIFEKVCLNPFYFATKCSDKSNLDISRAILTDNWSKLRKKYAGINLFIVLFLSLIFFLPILTHSYFLIVLAKVDPALLTNRYPLWKVLLFGGKEGFLKLLYASLTLCLVFYNIARIWVTISIAKLKEEESFLKDSNFNLISIHPEKYKRQLKLDRALDWLLWISIGYSVLKLADTLSISVPAFS